MISPSLDQVRRFFHTLQLALYDKRLELSKYEITYYVDADVVIPAVAGFELDEQGSPRQKLVRSLLTCGFMGRVSMLRPHVLELSDYVGWKADQRSARKGHGFRNRVDAFIRTTEIREPLENLRRLATALRRTSLDSGEERRLTSEFIDILQSVGDRTFVALEMISAPWKRRLKRIYGSVLTLDDIGPEMRELLGNDRAVVNEMLDFLKSQPRSPRRGYANDYRDACALAMLHLRVRDVDERGGRGLVRFYTETELLKHAWKGDTSARGQLAYRTNLLDDRMLTPAEHAGVLRDTDYFLMRARFPALSFHAVGEVAPFDALIRGVSERNLLELRGKELDRALGEFKVEGQDLAEAISEFEGLALLKNIWTEGRIPADVLKSLPEWTDIFSSAQGESAVAIVDEKIGSVQAGLSQKVARLRRWMKDFELLRTLADRVGECVNERTGKSTYLPELEDLVSDLGLLRWGVVMREMELTELRTVLGALADPVGVDRNVICEKLATRMELARESDEDCRFVCGVLWALQRYRWLVSFVSDLEESCRKRGKTLPRDLLFWRSAAWIRYSASEPWDREKFRVCDAMIERMREEVSKEGAGESRGQLMVGLAYVLFHGGRLGRQLGQGLTEEEQSTLDCWLEESFRLGKEAVRELRPLTLAWGLAVNHCVYVGMSTNQDRVVVLEYHENLRKLETLRVWNARFDDTVGCFYMKMFEDKLRERGSRIGRADVLQLESLLDDAGVYLSRAKANNVGDIAVGEHMARLLTLNEKIRSLAEGLTRTG